MDRLIRLKATGSPANFSRKLGISRSTLFVYLKQMRELGAPIYYCRKAVSFCYLKPVKFEFGFKVH